MRLSRPHLILLAAGGSAATLLGALAFQYVGGMPPCKMCYWQRYPHLAAVAIGLIALMVPGRFWPMLGALAALVTAGIGVFHAGVERKLWAGPSSCTSGDIGSLSSAELMEQIMTAPLVRCDVIPWELFGLSMAGWNAAVSGLLVLVWLMAAQSRV
ncbi:disulfide bond formation protein B [Lentibacter algarum]|uniref:disulfide bond formation protein B n=1 Tax=Lentibacter algarum TaxID=576131 RepID=UPI001C0A4C1A|nr:disulfide bond formation protein B [Lentibacter algarum]MBU2982520.1 disulfide bond formation protein B [Lentibacter algarum]